MVLIGGLVAGLVLVDAAAARELAVLAVAAEFFGPFGVAGGST